MDDALRLHRMKTSIPHSTRFILIPLWWQHQQFHLLPPVASGWFGDAVNSQNRTVFMMTLCFWYIEPMYLFFVNVALVSIDKCYITVAVWSVCCVLWKNDNDSRQRNGTYSSVKHWKGWIFELQCNVYFPLISWSPKSSASASLPKNDNDKIQMKNINHRKLETVKRLRFQRSRIVCFCLSSQTCKSAARQK